MFDSAEASAVSRGSKARRRHLRQRHGEQRLAGGAQQLRQDQLVHADVVGEADVDEAAQREQQRPRHHQQPRVEALHQQRHGGEQHELRQPAPHHHVADLLGVVALDLRAIDRDDVDRAERHGAQHRHQQAAAADRAVLEDAQVDEGPLRHQLAQDEAADAEHGQRRPFDDDRRAEPVLALPLLEHEGQGRQARRHQADAEPVALRQLAELERRGVERVELQRQGEGAGHEVQVEDVVPRQVVGQPAADRRARWRARRWR